MLPRSVDIVVGDVGDPATVKAAVSGCSKIIYCATARSTITGDLNRVDNQGVRNASKAFQVSFWVNFLMSTSICIYGFKNHHSLMESISPNLSFCTVGLLQRIGPAQGW